MTVCLSRIKMQPRPDAFDMTLETATVIAIAVFFFCPNSDKRAPNSPSMLTVLVGAS
jgi:hypothetical protein